MINRQKEGAICAQAPDKEATTLVAPSTISCMELKEGANQTGRRTFLMNDNRSKEATTHAPSQSHGHYFGKVQPRGQGAYLPHLNRITKEEATHQH
jgi:hypothetical protein